MEQDEMRVYALEFVSKRASNDHSSVEEMITQAKVVEKYLDGTYIAKLDKKKK